MALLYIIAGVSLCISKVFVNYSIPLLTHYVFWHFATAQIDRNGYILYRSAMQHVAIMRTSWGLLPQILRGNKTIESRWYVNRTAPWGKIHAGDIVYFKNAGEPVTVQATIAAVRQVSNLSPALVASILHKFGSADGISEADLPRYINRFKNRRYCILLHLTDPMRIKSFHISKKGYGAIAAWLTTPSIERIRLYKSVTG